MLDVADTSGTYTIESLDCDHNEVQIDLFDGAREKQLATGTAATPAGCSALTYDFPEVGRYAIHVAGAGEYSLRVTAE
jgi:hypothetical protein